MLCAIIPGDHTTVLVNQDITEMERIVNQVRLKGYLKGTFKKKRHMSIVLTDMKIVHGDVPCNKVDAVKMIWLLDAAFHAVFDTKTFRFSLDMVN